MNKKSFALIVLVLTASTASFGQKLDKARPQKTPEESQALIYVKQNDVEGMRAFLTEKKLEDTVEKVREENALWLTAEYGTVEMMRLLAEDLRLDTGGSKFGRTLIHRAAEAGNKDMVQFLVEEEHLNPRDGGVRNYTPLHAAARRRNGLETVRYLIEEAGVDPDVKDSEGRTPLLVAAYGPNPEIFRYLIEEAGADCKNDLVVEQVNKSDNEEVNAILHQKLNRNTKQESKKRTKRELNSALFDSIQRGYLSSIKELTAEKSLKLNKARNSSDYTALQYAIQCDQLPIVRYFFEEHRLDTTFQWGHAANPDALQWAVVRGKLEIVQYLIEEQGFDPDDKDDRGHNAFLYAISAKIPNQEMIQYLIDEHNADIERKDRNGCTALMRAISFGNLNTVKYLIEEAGADTSVRNSYNENIYQLASRLTIGPKILKYLVETLEPDPEKDIGTAILEKVYAPETKEYLLSLMD